MAEIYSGRRSMLLASLYGGIGFVSGSLRGRPVHVQADTSQQQIGPGIDYKVSKGRLKQSVMGWCFKPMPMPQLIEAGAKMGLSAIEGIDKKHYPLARKHGLGISIVGSHGFAKGPVNPKNHEFCIQKLREGIDTAVKWDSPGVITFTGMREESISNKQSFDNCVACWKKVMPYAEQKGVNVVLEMLNTRDDTHPMKGHPGYFGDDIDRCVNLIKAVGSPRMKLLFDVYHVQVMNGDPIRRFLQNKDLISHVHTAGNPGRCELDDRQELNYKAIMNAIADSGFNGFVAQEFIPTWKDPLAALRHAVKTCDV